MSDTRGRGGPFGRRGGPFGGHGMAMPVEKPKNFKASFGRLLAYLKPRLPSLLVVLLMAALSTAFAIFSPKLMGRATTRLFEGFLARLRHVPGAGIDFHYILQIVLILAGLYLLSALFSYIQQFIMAGVAQKTVYELRREVSEKLARLPLKFYDGRTHGEILSRVTNDVDNIASTLQQSLTQIIASGFTLVGVLIMMFTISPLLTLITIVVIPLALFVTRVVAPRAQKHFTEQWKNLGELNGHIEEMYSGHSIVKAFGHERKSVERFDKLNEKLYGASWRAQFISGLLMPLMTFVNNVGYVAVAVVGGLMVARRALQIGDIQSTVASAERVFELLDEPEEVPDGPESVILSSPRGEVAVQDVYFSYHPEVPLIEDLSIEVKQGETIAIVGPTGAGKTTLVNLLMRFYEIQAGRITVDGKDIREIKRSSLRRSFGMVLQDTWLFHGTIRENIGYGRPQATDEEIFRAAEAAHADHFIRTLPDGYSTVLNEEASNISQGQKQLLTIARAILTDPVILILDEATSNVDARTEILIQKAMAGLMKGRTSFVIAHRLSTIRDAELILVMDHGRIIETGSHRALLARGGFYADLYNSQFAGALAEHEVAGG